MRKIFIPIYCLLWLIGFGPYSHAQKITDTTWLDKPHFKITTKTATYLYDKAGGGLSSLFDAESNDWIAFNESGNDEFPASAAGRFRGLPNFVYGSDNSGAGHPGFEQCVSQKISDIEILTTSKDGIWQWRWQFSDKHAQVTMEKVDPDHAYWFLYEGIPGGSFQPKSSYWGTNTRTPTQKAPNYVKGDKLYENWDWIYFGREDTPRVFFIKMQTPDQHSDLFSYLGNTEEGIDADNGMLVFGFGRKNNAIPLMTATDNTFVLGFYPKQVNSKKQYKKFSKFIKGL